MRKIVSIVGAALLLAGCKPDSRQSADKGIAAIIKRNNLQPGYCETLAVFANDIPLPYYILVCRNN